MEISNSPQLAEDYYSGLKLQDPEADHFIIIIIIIIIIGKDTISFMQVFIQTMSLRGTMLQQFCRSCLWRPYHYLLCWL
jgi:hypothetical protein